MLLACSPPGRGLSCLVLAMLGWQAAGDLCGRWVAAVISELLAGIIWAVDHRL
jgi:hypothetical protein